MCPLALTPTSPSLLTPSTLLALLLALHDATVCRTQMFVKYNGLLRGLQSPNNDYLTNSMVKLCCSKDTADQYRGGKLSFEQAKTSLNTYTTTLHGINSAIIKLGKLTLATKVRTTIANPPSIRPQPLPSLAPAAPARFILQVYRGISGMALPAAFWEPNEFRVRGGVENAFMSTTLDRVVAMGYASTGGENRMGIVIEVQQGMVSRGADMSWLSQYPHERE